MSNKETFETFLRELDEEGGKIEYVADEKGDIKTFFVASKTMIESFVASDPPLIQVDLPFDVDKARYKIAALCYLNPTTNATEIAAIAYTDDETAVRLDFVFRNFTDICTNTDKIFIVDKDFTQMESIKKHFPDCTVLLCQFHTLKFMRTLFATALVKVEKKTELYSKFKQVVYAYDEATFNSENAEFMSLCTTTDVSGTTPRTTREVLIRVNKNYQPLKSYYQKNWESCKSMWVKCFRKHLPILGDNTTNRVERTFWSLKQSLRDTFRGLPDTANSIMHVVKLADGRLKERYDYSSLRSLRIFDSNDRIQTLNDTASRYLNDRGCTIFHSAQKMLEKYREKLSLDPTGVRMDQKLYETTSLTCNCSFHKTHQSPCLHILFLRENDNEGFSENLFINRYYKNNNQPSDIVFHVNDKNNDQDVISDSVIEEDDEDNIAALDEREKYKIVTPIVLRIGNLIAAHSSRKFLQYIDQLESVEKLIRHGQSIVMNTNDMSAIDEENIDLLSNLINDSVFPTIDSFESESVSVHQISPSDTVSATVPPGRNLLKTSVIAPVPTDLGDAISTNLQTAPYPSKFTNLAFKDGVTTKGRPRKRGKQISFRRTQSDQQPSRKKKKIPKGSKTPDFNSLVAEVCAEENSIPIDQEYQHSENMEGGDFSFLQYLLDNSA